MKSIYLLLLAPLLSCTHPHPSTGAKIIHPRIVREMTATYSIKDEGKSKYAFDNSGGFVDPMNGVTSFPDPSAVKHVFPVKQYGSYYPDWSQGYPGQRTDSLQGLNLLVDLTGAADLSDTSHTVTLSAIYGASATYDAGDTAYFYDFTPYFRAPLEQRWKYLAYPHKMLTPIGNLVTEGGGRIRWQHFTTNTATRYIFIRVLPRNRGNYASIPDYNKFVFYGDYNYKDSALATVPDSYTGPIHAPTYGALAGTNLMQGIDTRQTLWDGKIRVYGNKNYWDRKLTRTLDTMVDPEFPDIGLMQYPTYIQHGQTMWWNINGGSNYLASQNPAVARKAIDSVGADPRNPMSYAREAKFAYNFAAHYSSVAVPTQYTCWYPRSANGLNLMHAAELTGNEEDYHGSTLVTIWARGMAAYNGWENRIGIPGHTGAKNADPSFAVIACPTTLLDTNAVSVFVFCSATMTTSKHLPFDIFNYHYYPFGAVLLGRDASYEEQVGSHGIQPEKANLLGEYSAYTRFCYKWANVDTSYKIYNTEYGYGNWAHPPRNVGEVSWPWDGLTLPGIPGVDSARLKAIFMCRSEIQMLFTGIDGYNEFAFSNSDFGPNGFRLFQSNGRTTGRNISPPFNATTLFPWFYVRQFLFNNLFDYRRDAYIENGGATGRHVVRLRSVSHPQNVVYIAWKGVYDNSTLQNQTIPTGKLAGTATLKQFSFSDSTGTTTVKTPSGGITNIGTIGLQPVFLFGRE